MPNLLCYNIGHAACKDFKWVSCRLHWLIFLWPIKWMLGRAFTHTVLAISDSLWRANQVFPFHAFQFSAYHELIICDNNISWLKFFKIGIIFSCNNAHTTLGRNLIGRSTLSQRYCEVIGLVVLLANNEKATLKINNKKNVLLIIWLSFHLLPCCLHTTAPTSYEMGNKKDVASSYKGTNYTAFINIKFIHLAIS